MSRYTDASQAKPLPVPAIRAAGIGYLLASVALFGVVWPATKYAFLLGATPAWFAFGRAALSGLAAFLVLGLLGRLRLPGRGDLPTLLAVGVLQLAAFFALSHEAGFWIPAGRTGILANTTTIWIVPLSLIVLGEAISPRRWLATASGLAGVAVLSGPWAIDWTERTTLIGHALLLGAAFSFAAAIVIVRARPPRLTMLELLPWCFLLASLVLLPLALWRAPLGGVGPAPAAWATLLLIGVVVGPVGTWCVLQATAMLPAMISSVGFLAAPAIGLLLSVLLLGEELTPSLLVGSALIFAGLGIAAWPSRRAR